MTRWPYPPSRPRKAPSTPPDEWTLSPRLALSLGLRYSLYQALGPRDVYQYQPGEIRKRQHHCRYAALRSGGARCLPGARIPGLAQVYAHGQCFAEGQLQPHPPVPAPALEHGFGIAGRHLEAERCLRAAPGGRPGIGGLLPQFSPQHHRAIGGNLL
ncbi:MAG: hypothetical protein WKG07_36880 [Hymenobacter sp.]